LIYADGVNISDGRVNTVQKNTAALIFCSPCISIYLS